MSSVYAKPCTPKAVPIVRREDFKSPVYSQEELAMRDKYGNTDELMTLNLGHFGRFTVLDRLTGFGWGDIRDIESGFKEYGLPTYKDFWLVSGMFDIRNHIDPVHGTPADELAGCLKSYANTVIGG